MLTLLLSLLPQTAPPAAPAAQGLERLHPAGAVVFLQVPDVQAMLSAYRQAPVVLMVQDEAVGETVGGLLGSFGLDLGQLLAGGAQAMGLPAELAADPGASLMPWIDRIQDVSFSLSMGEDLAAEDLVKQLLAFQQMKSLSSHLQARQAEGDLPAELSDLGTPELLVDPWGTPYVYRPDAESGLFQLTSLGAGGRPGGAGIQRDLEAEEVDDLLRWVTRNSNMLAAAHLRDPTSARMAGEWLTTQLKSAGASVERHDRLFVGERSLQVLVSHDATGFSGWILQSGKLLAVGTGSLDALAARVEARGSSLASASRLSALREKLPAAEGARIFDAFLDTESLHHVLSVIAPGMASPLGSLRGALAIRSQLRDGRFTTELSRSEPLDSSWLSTLGTQALPEGLWRLLPEEAIGFYSTSFDAELLFDELLALSGADPARMEELEARYGFSVERDIFASLGNAAVGYLLPITAVITVPGIALVVEVKDRERFQKGIEGLASMLNDVLGEGYTLKMRPYRDTPLWTLSTPQAMGGMVQVSPSLALVEGHAILTITSTRAKKEIKRALGEEDARLHALFSTERKPPAEAVSFGYLDWPSLLSGIYGGARSALTMVGGMLGELPFQAQDLPSAEIFVRFLEPTTLWTKQAGAGSYTRIEGPFGPEAVFGLTVLFAAITSGVMTSAPVAVEQEPTVFSLQEPEEVSVTRSTMDYLRTRLAVYRIENGRYPPALEKLVESSEHYPKGYLKEQVLPLDGWGRAFRYGAAEDGASFRVWSLGPDGVDQQGDGDDVQG